MRYYIFKGQVISKRNFGVFISPKQGRILVGQNFRALAYEITIVRKLDVIGLKYLCMCRANVLHFQGSVCPVVSRLDGRYETSSEEATFFHVQGVS